MFSRRSAWLCGWGDSVFTAVSAAVGPLLMGLVGDIFGHVKYGFYLATGFAILLCLLSGFNLVKDPARHLLTAEAH
ncbi:hypothetical protein LFREDSHE_00730 [Shewanella baltica]